MSLNRMMSMSNKSKKQNIFSDASSELDKEVMLNPDYYMHYAIVNALNVMKNSREQKQTMKESLDYFEFEIINLETVAKADGLLTDDKVTLINEDTRKRFINVKKDTNETVKRYIRLSIRFEWILRFLFKTTKKNIEVDMLNTMEKEDESI